MSQAGYIALLISMVAIILLGIFSILRIEETRSSVVRLEPDITALSTALDGLKNQQVQVLAELETQQSKIDSIGETTINPLPKIN